MTAPLTTETLNIPPHAIAETIQWRRVADELPDADTIVVVMAPGCDEPVWLGFYDGVYWFSVDGPTYGDPEEIAAAVTAWAPLPLGDML